MVCEWSLACLWLLGAILGRRWASWGERLERPWGLLGVLGVTFVILGVLLGVPEDPMGSPRGILWGS